MSNENSRTTLNLTLDVASPSDGRTYFPSLSDQDEPVVADSVLTVVAAQATTSSKNAKGAVSITYDPGKIASVEIQKNDTSVDVTTDRGDTTTTVTWKFSETDGVMAKDYGITFLVELTQSYPDADSPQGDWSLQEDGKTWRMDPIVRLQRTDYNLRLS